jgi:hypothetical protein
LPAKFLWHWVPQDCTLGDRLALVIKDAVFAILPPVVGICIVAAQRLNPNMWVGRTAKPNSALDINTSFILNTFEQSILYFIGNAALAIYCPLEEARTLIILTVLFVFGRVLFWVGYHPQPVRARLRFRAHLLPNSGRLCLAHPCHVVRNPRPALTGLICSCNRNSV